MLINANHCNGIPKAKKIAYFRYLNQTKIDAGKKFQKWPTQGFLHNKHYQYYTGIVYVRAFGADYTSWQKTFGLCARKHKRIGNAQG